MKSDRRVIYTKKVIKESLLLLLENNPLNKITVKQVCLEAEINRGTFYRHYVDIIDLYVEIESEFINQISADINVDNSISTLLNLIYKNQGFYREFFNNHLESHRIKKLLNEVFMNHAMQMLDDKNTMTESLHAQSRFMYYGILGMIIEWTRSTCQIPLGEFETTLKEIIEKFMFTQK
jgi:AcrR family transcriptional regulator